MPVGWRACPRRLSVGRHHLDEHDLLRARPCRRSEGVGEGASPMRAVGSRRRRSGPDVEDALRATDSGCAPSANWCRRSVRRALSGLTIGASGTDPAPSIFSCVSCQRRVEEPQMTTGAQALIFTLLDAGVEVCFANPGTSEMHFVAALDDVPEMRGVLCLFEGVVTGAADGYARIAGTPAATLLHLARAWEMGWPICTMRVVLTCRWSMWSATMRPTTSSTTHHWNPTSRRSRSGPMAGCGASDRGEHRRRRR